MRTFSPVKAAFRLSIMVSLTVANSAFAQTATTVPVGFIQKTVLAAVDASTPTSTTISVPFYQSASYAGAISTVDSANQISISTAGFGTYTYNPATPTTQPYFLHMKSGASVGRSFLIRSNSATQLTVDSPSYAINTVIAPGDTFEVVPGNTLGSLFGTSSVPFQTATTAGAADDIYLWDGSAFQVYFHNGTNWKRGTALNNQNFAAVYPDDGLFITRRGLTDVTLTLLGTVPSTAEKTDIPGPASNFVANRFPVDTTLGALGLTSLPGWQNGTTAGTSDNVSLFSSATNSYTTYYYNGTIWKKGTAIGSTDYSNTVIPSGSAYFIVRRSSASGSVISLNQNLPYALN